MPLIVPALWNLFLALLPLALARPVARNLLRWHRLATMERAALGAVALAWLVLLPNTVYLLCDVRHLLFDAYWRNLSAQAVVSYTAMFEIAVWAFLFLGYGVTGLVLYTLALRPVERAARLTGPASHIAAIAFACLVSLGVYLGLIYRLNSWDLLTHPGRLVTSILATLSRARSVAGIVGFGLFLFVWHRGCTLFLDALRARWLAFRSRATARRSAPRAVPAPAAGPAARDA